MAKSAFLANITTIAKTAALQASADLDLRAEFRSHSDAIAPTEGWRLPVAPQGITLYGYQSAAVETILTFRRAIIGFAPGLGKTAVALSAIAALADQGKRTVVVVPPSLRVDPWQREAARLFPGLRVALVEGTKAAPLPDADVVVIGDSVISARLADVLSWAPDALFVDEAQRHKSRTAKRAKATTEVAEQVRVTGGTVVLLTGTLAVNNPGEVYQPALIAGIAKELSGSTNWGDFLTKWCVTETVWTGVRNVLVPSKDQDPQRMAELHERLRQTAYVRVERDAVLDMPEKVWAVRDLHLNGALAQYRRMERDFLAWVAAERGKASHDRAKKAEAITKLMALWAEAGNAKVKAAVEYIASLVEQGEQVVAMAWHKAVVTALAEGLAAEGVTSVQVVGGLSSEAKAEAQDTFRSGKADVLIGNITAAGTGLNLDCATQLVFVQLPWSPGDLVQASDRIYRVTQRNACTIHVLNGLDTVDDRMWAILNGKAEVVDRINTGETGATISVDAASVTDSVLADYGWDD
jgi:SWI/SNF-related matrix-associated actin-dependent regulator 1 of chromatin subfamily A